MSLGARRAERDHDAVAQIGDHAAVVAAHNGQYGRVILAEQRDEALGGIMLASEVKPRRSMNIIAAWRVSPCARLQIARAPDDRGGDVGREEAGQFGGGRLLDDGSDQHAPCPRRPSASTSVTTTIETILSISAPTSSLEVVAYSAKLWVIMVDIGSPQTA